MKIILIAAALIFACSYTVYGVDDAERIASIIRDAHKSGRFSGAALVARGRKVIFKGSAGMADVEKQRQNTVATPFRLASMTKGLTATLVLQSIERGDLKLDSSLADLLPEAENAALRPVTVHHLLSHTSGIPDFRPAADGTQTVRDALIARLHAVKLDFAPGEKFAYCNGCFTTLGIVLEKISGKPFRKLAREHLFRPAGMGSTMVEVGGRAAGGRATGYKLVSGELIRNEEADLSSVEAAGAVVSTVEDLFRFSRALSAGRLLSLDMQKGMLNPVGGEINGYGVFIRPSPAGGAMQVFAGGMPGSSTVMARVNGGEIVVILLSNLSNVPLQKLAEEILRSLQTQP
jgi:CubicO group peptidase (beta-lactamase class C family)